MKVCRMCRIGKQAKRQNDFFASWRQKIDSFINSNHVDGAVRVIDDMLIQKLTVPPEMLAAALKSLAKDGNANTSIRLLEACQKNLTKPNASCYTQVIHSFRKKIPPDPGGALNILNIMEKKNIVVSCICYNDVIGCFNEANEPERAAEILERMDRKNLRPDRYNYANLIQGFAHQGDADKACFYLQQAESVSLIPDLYCYHGVIHAFSKRGNPTGAYTWLQRAKNKHIQIDMVCYNKILSAYAKLFDGPGAAKFLMEEMVQKNVDMDIYSINPIISAYANVFY